MKFKQSKYLLALVPFVLTACSGAPGDDDLRGAMKAQASQLQSNPFTAPMAEMVLKNLDKLHLVDCKKSDLGGYQCDMSGGMGNVQSIRMVKDQGKWAIAQ
ncbi:hypothetical protein [Burkholderia sp. F1]|uniref:hypothetical protein n=1 Tax=Burkholderia sp. F1 TaxID=3366817 RepID=UPI003D74718F